MIVRQAPVRGSPLMSMCKTHRPEVKANVAMEAISGRKSLQEIVDGHTATPNQSRYSMEKQLSFVMEKVIRPTSLSGDRREFG